MQSQLIIDCCRCRARINKDAVNEFLMDVTDYLNDAVIGTSFEYLEDGSIGFAVLEKGFIIVNYSLPECTVRVEIYYRTIFEIPELVDRMTLYFIPESIAERYKEMT